MKYLFAFLVFFSIHQTLHSQRGLEGGAIIQPQIYGMYYSAGEPERAIKIPYSFAIAADLGYNFSDYFGIRTGFLYTPLGEKYNDLSTSPESAIEVNLEYFQIPLYLKINTSAQNRFSYMMIVGPHISFLNEATLTIDAGDPQTVLTAYERFVLGGALGLGIQVNLDRGDNVNFLWYNSASITNTNAALGQEANFISTGLQLSYHYFILGGN